MKTGALLSLFALASLSLLACASDAPDDHAVVGDGDTGESEEAATAAGRATYYRVTRFDQRKCAFPMCGGVYVARVNHATTKCADGTYQADCYVAQIDLSGLGLPQAQADLVGNEARVGRAVLRGSVKAHNFSGRASSIFDATEAWSQVGAGTASGTFFKVTDRGIRCITTPCPSFEQAKLNSTSATKLVGFDTSGAGLTAEESATVYEASTSGVIAAGANKVTPNAGPAGAATDLVAAATYVKVSPIAGFCEIDEQCAMTASTKPVSKKSDCYCRSCPGALDAETAAENEADYGKICGKFSASATCPQVKCMYRVAKCIENRCTAVTAPAN